MMNLSKSDCISRNIIRMAKRAYGICFEQSVTVVYHIQAVCKPKKWRLPQDIVLRQALFFISGKTMFFPSV